MTQAIEIHDAKLLELVRNDDGTGHVLFHAYIYRSEGVVFQDAQESGWQNFRLEFADMQLEGGAALPGEYAHEGELWVDGTNGNGMIHLPADHKGNITLELALSPRFDTLKIHASSVRSTLEGPWKLETYWDAEGNTSGHES
jgi:hypothetical protein